MALPTHWAKVRFDQNQTPRWSIRLKRGGEQFTWSLLIFFPAFCRFRPASLSGRSAAVAARFLTLRPLKDCLNSEASLLRPSETK